MADTPAERAWQRGQAALASGDAASARRWLDRAARLAPDDLTIALALAACCLGRDNAQATALFARVAEAVDVREAWSGLAIAELQRGDVAASVRALARCLGRHAGVPAVFAPAEAIAAAAGASGWCAVSSAGRLTLGLVEPARPVVVSLDGSRLDWGDRQGGLRRTLQLPSRWSAARRLDIRAGGRALIGSPIDLAAIHRVEGCVAADGAGGIAGWAWHPGDPDADPELHVEPVERSAPALVLRATELDPATPVASTALMRPRGFRLAAAALAGLAGALRVIGADGRNLLGSPLDPRPDQADARGAGARAVPLNTPRRRGVAVIVPVRDGGRMVLDCLASVLRTLADEPRVRLIVVDDASEDSALVAALDRLARQGRLQLIRHRRNRGFPASANAGIRAAGARDVVLLNSDTLTPPHWLRRLADAAYSAADIGTACPLSNDATILSYPKPNRSNPPPGRAETARLAALAWRVNGAATVDLPTAVGFCMFIRRDCLDAVGPLREDLFAQGYGEENDFCLRARALGWRHVAVPGGFVAHRGGGSFGGARTHLAARNAAIIERLYPDYPAQVTAHVAADPLAEARRRLDRLRWPAARRGERSVVLVSHDEGGGVARLVAARCAMLRAGGIRPIVLRPDAGGVVAVGGGEEFPNLRYALPGELAELADLLRRSHPERVEFHHLLGHAPEVMRLPALLGVPYAVHAHDYAWFCPRVLLVSGGRYCGEPDVTGCETCIAEHGRLVDEAIPIAALRRRSARFLDGAAEVTAPTRDAARRLARHFPGLAVEIVPHEPEPPPLAPRTGGRHGSPVRVCVVGALGVAKGFDVLLAVARDAAERRLPLEFTVVGHTIDDAALLDLGNVFVTGPYRPDEVDALIRAQAATFGWLPSIAPETWCFSLSELWRAGLDVVAFDLGAQAERIRARSRGMLLPLGLPAAALNTALLAAARGTGHEWRIPRSSLAAPACS